MSSNLPPPPPATQQPPPPPSTPPVNEDGDTEIRDNPIATASIVTSVLALVTAAIILGGFIAVISFVLAIVGLRRSIESGVGKGLSLIAMGLSLLALFAALVATGFWIVQLNTGDEFVIDGVASTSTNRDFPPQNDLDEVECTTSAGGGSALAVATFTNRSGGPSNYIITVAWDDDAGTEVTDTIRSNASLAADESQTIRLLSPRSNVDPESCRVTRVERWFFSAFAN